MPLLMKLIIGALEWEQLGSHGSHHGNGSDNHIMGMGMGVGIKVWEWK